MRGTRGKRRLDESEDFEKEDEEADKSDRGDRDSTSSKPHRRSRLDGKPLTEMLAKEILLDAEFTITPSGEVHCGLPMVIIHPGPLFVLGGGFELETLEALIFWVKAQQSKK